MTKQTINLLGGLVVVVIVLAGLFLGVLPRLDRAQQSHQARDTVAAQNQTQQTLISVYAQQRAKLPALQAEVAALKQQIPDGLHLEQLIGLASDLPSGAVLRSITPGEAAGATTGTTGTAGSSGSTGTTGTTGTTPAADGFASVPVTVVIGVRRTADAQAVLDKLRAGPRLFAIDDVSVTGGTAGSTGGSTAGNDKTNGSTLTVGGRVFLKETTQ